MNRVSAMGEGQSSAAAEGSRDAFSAWLPLGAALLFSLALIYWISGDALLAGGTIAALAVIGTVVWASRGMVAANSEADWGMPDWSITAAVADRADAALAVTDRAGRMVCANRRYTELFDLKPPPGLTLGGDGADRLSEAGRRAWREGQAEVEPLRAAGADYRGEVVRVGRGEDYLVWRFAPMTRRDVLDDTLGLIEGRGGRALSRAGIMAVAIGPEGRIRAATGSFVQRATGQDSGTVAGRDFASFLRLDQSNRIYFEREGAHGRPVRLLHVPLDPDEEPANGALPAPDTAGSPALILMVDQDSGLIERSATLAYIESLLAPLSIGLAMTDRDGRFLFANEAFIRASGLGDAKLPPYPGDLLIREDKGVIADAVRRYAGGRAQPGDIAVRLASAPEEPVSISLAPVRGVGDAAVLLSLKDSSEETRLKRQVAQATKMQAVGQLAGGVAHDFNNVLTAIIGHCDLMLMRHSPGDSDYDDIQHIKSNSNRAAALTRQLLAFSRQQTLRPQVLQLPDIVADVSSLLKRLLGETVQLEVSHDRNLGPIRADPGQLEQVIINLAVNARDAMQAAGKGKSVLHIRTRRFNPPQIRQLDKDILPPADYSALVVEDNGTGIPPDLQTKIFEPFFTTKEVGKGTGLGLSTVYGIVKQSGGYIFVDSEPGEGTRFTIFFPVHRGPAASAVSRKEPPKKASQWGDGRILLVEDEDMVRAVAERALARQGYTVTTARDGEEGLAKLREDGAFDLVVSDVVMPNLDGPAMAAEIRKTHPDLPILFMSGYAEEQLRKSITLDQVHFLPKPFSVAQIAEAVGAALAEQDGTAKA